MKQRTAITSRSNSAPHDADFVQLYLEQNQKDSNIYFFLEQQSRAHKKKGVPQKMTAWRFAFSFGSLAVFAILIVSFSFLGYRYAVQRTPPSFTAVAYDDILKGDALLSDFRMSEAAQKFHDAQRHSVPQASKHPLLSSLVTAFSHYFSSSEQPVSPGVPESLEQAVQKLAQGYGSLARVSSDALFAKNGAVPAGVLFSQAKENIKDAQKILAGMQDVSWQGTSVEEGRQVSAALANVELIAPQTDTIMPYVRFLAGIFDPEHPKKILVVLQNKNIPRATGGFIDAYGVITVENGAITKISFDDMYNLDGQLQAKIIPPRQLQNDTTSWGMRDANWFLDFPTSARKIVSFYHKSGGDEVDGVITLNEELVMDALRLTGPLETSLGEISADTILSVLRTHATASKDGKSMPVTVMNEVFPLLITKLASLSGESISLVMHMMSDDFSRKDSMAWFAGKDLQKMVAKHGIDGSVVQGTDINYTAFTVHDTNEDAAQSSLREDVFEQVKVMENGDVINTAAIEFHTKSDEAPENGDGTLYYVKLYVPKGSQLIASSGGEEQIIVPQIDYASEHFVPDEDVYASESTLHEDHANKVEVFEEAGKTVFGTWVTQGAKGMKLLYHYKLPFTLPDAKGPLVSVFQKQPGMHGTLQFSVTLPDGRQFDASDPRAFFGDFSGAFAGDLNFRAVVQ